MRGVIRLAFNDVGFAGHVGDVDAGHTCDAARNNHICTDHMVHSRGLGRRLGGH